MNSETFLRYTLRLSSAGDVRGTTALDYHPAVADILALPVTGWEEAADGSAITFWLETDGPQSADGNEGELAALLANVRRHGDIEVTAP